MIPLDDWRKAARETKFGAARLAWWAANDDDFDKPLLLLIHGYPTSSWDWSAIWTELARDFRLVAVDMLGFGLSDKPRAFPYSIMTQADIQEAILAEAGASEAHVFCHDYGNTVGQELLARQEEGGLSFALKSICFLNGGLFPEQHRARPIQKLGLTPLGPLLGLMMSRARLRKSFDEVFGPNTRASEEEIDGHWALISENGGARILHKLLHYIPERAAHRERWVGALKSTRAPMRLIDGAADPVSGAHLYYYYIEQVPKADAVLLPEIGHYPHTEAPQEVLRSFREFQNKMRTITA